MRRWFDRHVDFAALERFLGDELGEKRRRKVAGHLQRCAGCRARLQWLRSLADELEAATRPPLPDGVEERILARRASGERVILPVREGADEGGGASRLRRIGPVAALALLGLLGGLFVLHNLEARPEWSELSFDPARPAAGARVEVTYRPALEFGDQERLVLRGRVTGPVDFAIPPPEPERLTVLERSGDVYRGAFTLDPGDVYAQAVVEDSAGSRVDDRGGRFWHLHVYESDRPLRDALWAHALLSPDWEDRYETIRRATRLYPYDARLRAGRLSHELEFMPREERDSALAAHRAELPTIARRVAERVRPTAEELVGLVEYARTVGDSAAAREWTRRLVERYPTHPETVWYRLPPAPAEDDPRAARKYLAALDSLWREAGPHPALAASGFWVARQLQDSTESLVWAAREMAHSGWAGHDPGHVALLLADVPSVRAQASGHLRRVIRRLEAPSGEPRPLGRTVGEHARERRDAMRPLLAKLGELLLAEGGRRAALDTLRLAASIGWSLALHRRVAELELAAGDTLAAATSLARATASPFDRPAERLAGGLGVSAGPELVGRDEWELLRRAAADERYRSVLSRSVSRELRVEPVHLYDAEGRRHTLRELRRRTVTVVAFWEPWCVPAVRDLPELRRTAYLVRAIGGELIAVTEEAPGERLAALLAEHRADLTLYHDLDRRASAAFQQYGAPEYFVLDLEGRIRFQEADLDDVVAQVDALLNEPRLHAAAPGTARDAREESR